MAIRNRQLDLFNTGPNNDIPIEDPTLRERLLNIGVPEGYTKFSRKSSAGLHVIGIEKEEPTENDHPIIAIPGFCHGNWSFIKLMEKLGPKGFEFQAVSPPGEAQSRSWGASKSMENLRMKDYLASYLNYLRHVDRKAVLLGYSLGGLMALHLALKARGKILATIGINSVKPPNLCKRTYNIVGRKRKDGEITGPEFIPEDESDWILHELFNGNPPKDISWIMRRLWESKGSNAVLDDYANPDKYGIDPKEFDLPYVEFIGTEDTGETTGVYNDARELGVEERYSELVERGRVAISDVLSKKNYGSSPYSQRVRIDNGSHASLLMGEHVELVAEGIEKHWEKLTAKPEASSGSS